MRDRQRAKRREYHGLYRAGRAADGDAAGQIDPGVLLYLIIERGMEPSAVRDLLYRESGLRGMSGVSSDVRDLEASAAPAAAFAIEYFVYRIGLCAGMLAAALGGVDAFVFTAGIGENSPTMRARIAERLGWLGAIARSGRQCGEQDRHLSAREQDKALRRAHGRGAGDCSAHDLASVETPKGGRQGRDVKPDLVVARAAVVIRCLRHFCSGEGYFFRSSLTRTALPCDRGTRAGRLDDDIAGHADQRFDLGAHLPCLGAAVTLRERRVGRNLHFHRQHIERAFAGQDDLIMRCQPREPTRTASSCEGKTLTPRMISMSSSRR